MRVSLRAAQAAGLLIGFYLLGSGVIVALVAADVIAVWFVGRQGSTGISMLVLFLPFTVYVLLAAVQGVFVSTRFSTSGLPGVPVAPDDEPELWARVARLARLVGTRSPHRVLIGTDADATVWERGHLLGLLPGKRYVIIGAPLLLALSPAQLDAVLAHELGHYRNRDTRLAALAGRGRISILTTMQAAEKRLRLDHIHKTNITARRLLEPLAWWYFVLALRIYAHLFFSLTQATSRAQEYAADRIAARIAGREAIASALVELPVIASAYRLYLDKYVYSGLPLGLLPEPAEVIGGFASLIADPQRQAEFDRKRREPPIERASRFDSHPPLSDRLGALPALPDDGTRLTDATDFRQAVEILRDRERVLTLVGQKLLGDVAVGKTPVGWAELVDTVAFDWTDRVAAPLVEVVAATTGVPVPTPRSLLDVVDSGRLDEVLDRLGPAGSGRTVLARRLRQWVLLGYAERGQVQWRLSWAQPAILDAPPGLCTALDAAIAALLSPQHDTDLLRAILDEEHEKRVS